MKMTDGLGLKKFFFYPGMWPGPCHIYIPQGLILTRGFFKLELIRKIPLPKRMSTARRPGVYNSFEVKAVFAIFSREL